MSLNRFIYIHVVQLFFPNEGESGKWLDLSPFLTRKEATQSIKRFEEISSAQFRFVSRRKTRKF